MLKAISSTGQYHLQVKRHNEKLMYFDEQVTHSLLFLKADSKKIKCFAMSSKKLCSKLEKEMRLTFQWFCMSAVCVKVERWEKNGILCQVSTYITLNTLYKRKKEKKYILKSRKNLFKKEKIYMYKKKITRVFQLYVYSKQSKFVKTDNQRWMLWK